LTDLLTAPEKLTATDVRSCIQTHYGMGGEQYAVLFEVRNGTAWRANRSVDAVVMGLWPSLGMDLMGMEIKVSRSDWLHEYRNPGKASEVFDYFDKWWLVAPANVAKMEEIPEPWGWLVPENGKLRKVRDAATNPKVKPADRNFLAALMRRTAKTDDAFVAKAVEDAVRASRKQSEADAEKRALERLGDLRTAADEWMKVRALLEDKPDDYVYQPDVIAALRVVMKAGVAKSWTGLRQIVSTLDRSREEFNKIASDLGIEMIEPDAKLRRRR
jgi:hypothetical protein